MNESSCLLAGKDGLCGPVKARGWCSRHYARWREHGNPLARRQRGPGQLLAEVEAAARAETDECVFLTGFAGRPSVKLNGVRVTASRAVWIIACGDPGEKHVLHTCNGGSGESGCINRRHLVLGDEERNSRDKVEAGNSTRGERMVRHVLKEEQVQAIRRGLAAGTTKAVLAKEYGVSFWTIRDIETGKTWSWLSPEDDQA